MPFDLEITRCAIAAGLACLAAIWLRPSPFWAMMVGRPFVLARVRPDGPHRFRSAAD